jgi:hypothetical protein
MLISSAMSLLALLVAFAAFVLVVVLVGTLLIVGRADVPAPVEGASAFLYRHVIAACLIVVGAGTPWLASFGNARGLVLLMCFAALGGAWLIWKPIGLRWLAVFAALTVLIGELA